MIGDALVVQQMQCASYESDCGLLHPSETTIGCLCNDDN